MNKEDGSSYIAIVFIDDFYSYISNLKLFVTVPYSQKLIWSYKTSPEKGSSFTGSNQFTKAMPNYDRVCI